MIGLHHQHQNGRAGENPGGHVPVDYLAPGLTLEAVQPVLRLYFRALTGRVSHLLALTAEEAVEPPADSETTVRLPARIDKFASDEENFLWYKVALTHRAMHDEAGTLDFRFCDPATRFERLMPTTLDQVPHYPEDTDLVLYFRLFSKPRLAKEIFGILEDFRMDEWAKRRYPGIRSAFRLVQEQALNGRPDPGALPPRAALAEVLVRLSLGVRPTLRLPEMLHDPGRQLAEAVQQLADPGARVADTAEAALRAYSRIAQMPNLSADYGPALPVDLATPPSRPANWPRCWPEAEAVRLEGDAVMEFTIEPVDYRDRFGLRYMAFRPGGPFASQSIYTLRAIPESDPNAPGPASEASKEKPEGQAEEQEPNRPRPHEHGPGQHHHHHPLAQQTHTEIEGALHTRDPDALVYPEWDSIAGRYRANWCVVREKTLETRSVTKFYRSTLQKHGRLVAEVRRQLERLAPEGLRKVRRLRHGDDLDLDACIEALVDLMAGVSPSEFLYTSRERVQRDVAVAFLLDLSMSTGEQIEENKSGPQGRRHRTILDVEKESMVVMMAALERIGDTYGMYGFSGTGRDDVRFMILKEMNEGLSDRVIGRLESLKPIHTTRMGAAVRHAVRKLRGQEAQTKVLMVISDGRPFDHDYGQSYGSGAEVQYAINDTRKALDEAKQHGINPFLLTVDQEGQDYLRHMCEDIGYELLTDVTRLPKRLLSLYRHLTG